MTTHRDLLQTVIEQEAAVLPDGCDTWALKSVRADLRTRDGFRWAYPGGTSMSDHAVDEENNNPRPSTEGDGLCVAHTWKGMASGGIPARTLLLVAYPSANVLGYDEQKARLAGEVRVVALVDGERLIREHGRYANLRYANLRGADLQGADLRGADLRGVDLRGANLKDADLRYADLQYADIQGVDLRGADLQGAYLRYADLRGANLRYANLRGADLQYADLQGADLQGADLQGADLQGADLWGAEMYTLPAGWGVSEDGRAVKTT